MSKSNIMSLFEALDEPFMDPIFSLGQQFSEDTRAQKLNLGAGAYRDENGEPWLLPAVEKAENIVRQNPKIYSKEYPPTLGVPGFLKVSREFLLGADHVAVVEDRVATCQTISGSGALNIGFEFLRKNFPSAAVYFPEQTWGNHYALYEEVYQSTPYQSYAYVDCGTMEIKFEQTLKDCENAPNGSIFLLHACAHNPTGIDFTRQQWEQLLQIMKRKSHIPFIDNAYQGFASGSFEEDGWALRLFAANIECVIAQSFSKNFGLYGERVGACHIVHQGTAELTTRCNSAMALILRSIYSISPCHGAYLVWIVGEDPVLKAEFLQNVEQMAARIKKMRKALNLELQKLQTPGKWDHIEQSIGMFSYTGLSPAQVLYIQKQHGVYMLQAGGRACICGINHKNVEYLANAIHDTVANCATKD